jgi:hypothetical protein
LRSERLGVSSSQASMIRSQAPRSHPGYRRALVVERQQAAEALADLKVERGSVQVRRRSPRPSDATALCGELIWVGEDSEKVIRWLTALMVLRCDPLAIALIAAASARRSITVNTFASVTLDSCRGDAIERHHGRSQ